MFKELTNLSRKRSTKEALGFYLAYLLLTIIISMVLGATLGLANNQNTFEYGVRVGTATSVIVSIILSILQLKEKNLLTNFSLLIFALCSGIFAYLGGALLGMIIPSYFSTIKKNS